MRQALCLKTTETELSLCENSLTIDLELMLHIRKPVEVFVTQL